MERATQAFLMAANHPNGPIEDVMIALIMVGAFLLFLFTGALMYEAWFRIDRWFSKRKRRRYQRQISLLNADRLADEYEEAARRG